MRFAVLTAVLLAIALWLWLDSTDRDTEQTPPLTDLEMAPPPGPGLDGRAPPPAAGAAEAAALRVIVRLHGRPVAATVSIRRMRTAAVSSRRMRAAADDDVLDVRGLPPFAKTSTDTASGVRFAALEPGPYHLTARGVAGGFTSARTDVWAGAGEAIVILDLLVGPHRFEGRLVDGPRPAVGWRVQLRPATDWTDSDSWPDAEPAWSTGIDTAGRFVLAGLPHGRYVVRAVRPGRVSVTFRSVLVPAARERVFDVDGRTKTLAGVVRDLDTDAPIPSATLLVTSGSEGWYRAETVHSDERGHFTAPVGSSDYAIRAEAAGYSPRDYQPHERTDEPCVIHLARGGRIEGRVVTAEGAAPVPGAHVCLQWRSRASSSATWVTADDDGRFEIEDAPTGKSSVFVLGDGWCSSGFDFGDRGRDPTLCRVRPGETTRITVRIMPTCSLHGRVVDSRGAPVAGARVIPGPDFDVRNVTFPWLAAPVATASDGTFALADLVPSSLFLLSIRVAGRLRQRLPAYADPYGSKPLEIRLPDPARYVIEVLDAKTAKPISGATVYVADALDVHDGHPWTTDRTGRVAVDAPTERLELDSVLAHGYRPMIGSTLEPGSGAARGEPTTVTVRLRRGLEITGRVVRPEGMQSGAVTLSLYLESDDPALDGTSLPAVLDAAGRFTFQGVPPGTHGLQAWADWKRSSYEADVEVQAGARDVEVRLTPAGAWGQPPLKLRVRDTQGRDVARGMAFLFTANSKGSVSRDTELVHTGRATYRQAGAPPRWLVIVSQRDPSGLKSNLAPAHVGPLGLEDREVDVRLPTGRIVQGRVTDEAGRPISGVELSAHIDWRVGNFPEPFTIWLGDARSDTQGRFDLPGMPPEAFQVSVLRLPYGWTRAPPIDVGASESDVHLQLEPAGRASILVLDWKGKPVEGAAVRWIPRREDWNTSEISDGRTDDRGRAEFGHLRRNDPADLLVVPPSRRPDCLTYRLEHAPLEDRVVRLARGHAMKVTVLDARGNPVQGAMVWRNTGSGWTGSGRTPTNGTMTLRSLPAGEVSLHARKDGVEGETVRTMGNARACTLRLSR